MQPFSFFRLSFLSSVWFLPERPACSERRKLFGIMLLCFLGNLVTIERSKIYFRMFSGLYVNFCSYHTDLVDPLVCRQRQASVLLCCDAFWASYVSLLSRTLNSSLPRWLRCYEMWHEQFGCHLNYLYTPLLDVKIGLLCSATNVLFSQCQKWLSWEWSSILCECESSRWVVSIIYCFTVLRRFFLI